MRILYLSCHSICEFDEIKMFSELGYEVVSQGAYKNPAEPGESSRPPIKDAYYDEELASLAPAEWGAVLPRKLVDAVDVIYILGIEKWLPPNWERIKHKKVIFRSIGQAVEHTESVLAKFRKRGLKIVRYSPLERHIPGYSGEDAIIRFYKDQDEYKGWNGDTRRVITVAQAMKHRDEFLKFHIFEKATRGFPRKLYGPSNDDTGELCGGWLAYEDLKRVLRDNRAYFYTCTYPAQYTMAFQEAWMTGIPVVAIGSRLAGFDIEIPQMIENGVNGFTSDSMIDLRKYVSLLLDDHDLARRIGEEGRKSAIGLFGKEDIKHEWKNFFETIF